MPVLPQRVVTLSEPALDGALSVGLRPIATIGGGDQGGVSTYLAKQARGVVDVGARGRLDVEHVAALKPDLILVDDTAVRARAAIDELRRLAPTVHVSRAGQDWRTAFTAVADGAQPRKEGAHGLARVRRAPRAGPRRARRQRRREGQRRALERHRRVAGAGGGVGRRPCAGGPRAGRASAPTADGDWIFLGAPGTGGRLRRAGRAPGR